MMTLDDLKTNRDTQITVGCIAFFLIAFPLYFSFAASGVSSVAGTRGVGDYQINGNLTYVQLTDGIEYIADGDTYMIDDLHTDSIDDAEDMNIVGVRVVMSYGEDEDAQGLVCRPQVDKMLLIHFWYGNACRFQRYCRWTKQRWKWRT